MQAENGASAIAQCRLHPPDVILLDVVMPDLDGFQVLAILKDDPQLKDIPVVFLTGRTSMEDVVSALRAGAHDYLKKPFEPEELLARIGSAMHVKQLQDQLRDRNAELDRTSRTDALTGLFNRRHLDEDVILPRTDVDGALSVGERIRCATAGDPVDADGTQVSITGQRRLCRGPGRISGQAAELRRCLAVPSEKLRT